MSHYVFTDNKEKEELLDLMYPIGSIYISTNNINPSSIFGGHWRKITSRFLFGADSSGSDLRSEGGEKTHTLTIDEMPSHSHSYTWRTTVNAGFAGGNQVADNNTISGTTASTGGSQAHNNMPPYLTVNIWERYFPAQKGETYVFDGVEVYCLLGVESTHYPLFVDKNHDLSYYFTGSDYTDEVASSSEINSANKYGYEWGGLGTTTNIDAGTVGSGLSNTNSLINMNLQPYTSGWHTIWDKINEFRQSHSSNWFLPSSGELKLIYEAKENLSNLSISTEPYYWSSTEHSPREAYTLAFGNGFLGYSSRHYHNCRSRLCYTI